MKKIIALTFILGFINFGFAQKTQLNADVLVSQIDKYNQQIVQIEGTIIHVCGVDQKKMKLKTADGNIIKIVSGKSNILFDKTYHGKKISVTGKAEETRIPKTKVEELEKKGVLLCHIDQTACTDTAWVKRQVENGTKDGIVRRDADQLRERMTKTGKDYISQITIYATEIKVLEK